MATPTEHAYRDYEAYLRGPVPADMFCFGTVDAVRGGLQHVGLITLSPAPSERPSDDFGIVGGDSFTVDVADEADDLDWYLLTEDGSFFLLEDGSGRIILEN